jgi:hypothetical protein
VRPTTDFASSSLQVNVYTSRARMFGLIYTLLSARVRNDVVQFYADKPRVTYIIDTGSDQDRQRLMAELQARKEVTDRFDSLLVRYEEEWKRLMTMAAAAIDTAEIEAALKVEELRRKRDGLGGRSEVSVVRPSTTGMRVERPTGRIALACDYGSTWSDGDGVWNSPESQAQLREGLGRTMWRKLELDRP